MPMEAPALGEADHEVPVLENVEALVVAQVGSGVHQADERDVVRRQQAVRIERLAVDHQPAPLVIAAVRAEGLLDLLDVGIGDAIAVAPGEEARQGLEVIGKEEVVVVEVGDEPAARGVETGVQRARPAVRRRAVKQGQPALSGCGPEHLVRGPGTAVRDDQGLEVAQRLGAQAREGFAEQSRPVARPDDDGYEGRRHGRRGR